MADPIDIPGLYNQYTQSNTDYQQQQKATIDNITKLLQSNIPTPSDLVNIVGQVASPVTPFEVLRGQRRPTPAQVMEAGRASELQNGVALSGMLNQGMTSSAHQMQIAINAINAQAAQNNTQATPVKNVMSSLLTTLTPNDAVLFSNEYLGRMGNQPGTITDKLAWDTASQVISDLGLKGKNVLPTKADYYNENGDLVQPRVNPQTNQIETTVAPGMAGKLPKPAFSPIYNQVPIFDENGNQTGIQNVPSGTFNKQIGTYQKLGGQEGLPAQLKVTPPPSGMQRSPTGMQPILSSTQNKDLTDLDQQAATIDNAIKNVKAAPGAFGGSKAATLGAAGFFGDFAKSGAESQLYSASDISARAQLFNQVSAVIKERAGTAQTAQEMERVRAFLPSTYDNATQVLAKLQGFKEYLAERRTGVVPYQPKTGEQQSNSVQPSNDIETQSIANAKAAIAKGWSREAVEAKLKAAGIDPAKLGQ